ncbi:xylose isomerase-like protein [Trichodelitschia bisporula]|uniref:Xylose isomerase-like protein n=1 Tax=Trichodelitschia bisporula TaxID=703511 RepID=A0A6G1IBG7_9PEZI|nr:xylose isomerase-like protein [Trichodelitschia bisporula]
MTMALKSSSLSKIPTAFASCSIGCRDDHTLPKKLQAISAAGFSAIELSMPDIVSFASTYFHQPVASDHYDSLVEAARVIRGICDTQGLEILMLQPFSNFEGWQHGSDERKDAFDRARGWIRIMEAAGTDMLQVGSSDSPEDQIGTDRQRMVTDLQQLADMLLEHTFRLAYENWCWSTHAPKWRDAWDIMRQVDRPNFGLCLDTFQTAGSEWADPTTESGLIDSLSEVELNQRFQTSLEDLSKTVPKDRIYLLQISDAYKPKQPLSKETDDSGLRPRGRWSHDFRPLPFHDGYLPVIEVTKAVLRTGFRSWFSYEVFDAGADGKGRQYELDEFAKWATEAHTQLLKECAED